MTHLDEEIEKAAKEYALANLHENERLVWNGASDRTREELFPRVIERFIHFTAGAREFYNRAIEDAAKLFVSSNETQTWREYGNAAERIRALKREDKG